MPLPIDYIVFEQKHGRPPRSDELTLHQRWELLDCLLQAIRSAGKFQIARDAYASMAEDPNALNEIIAKLDSRSGTALRKMAFEHGRGYRAFAQEVLDGLLGLDEGPPLQHFIDLMLAVGIPRREAGDPRDLED